MGVPSQPAPPQRPHLEKGCGREASTPASSCLLAVALSPGKLGSAEASSQGPPAWRSFTASPPHSASGGIWAAAVRRPVHLCSDTESCPTTGTPWTVAHQAPPSMGFSRQENCSGLLFPTPRDLPNPEFKPWCPALQADSLPLSLQGHFLA